MKLIRQPQGSNLCGQACVATVGTLTLDDAIRIMSTKGKTGTKHIVQALQWLGIRCGTRRIRGFPKEGSAFLFFRHPAGRQGHWVVWHKKKYYDPNAGVFRRCPRWLSESRVTSHLKVVILESGH